jgi:beta-carotene hydroxylase
VSADLQAARTASRAALALPPQAASALERMSTPDGRVFSAWVVVYVAVWAAGVVAVAHTSSLPVQLLLSALLGSQLHALTVLQHDCGHRSAYGSAAANLWVGRGLALFVFMPFTTFTELHRRHHGFLGDERLDPDEWFYAAGPRWLFVREWLFLPRFIALSLGGGPLGAMRRRVAGELAVNATLHLALVAGLLAAQATQLLIFAYALPMLWLACVFNPLSRGFEHLPLAQLPAGDAARADLRLNTISTTSRLLGVLWANIGFHVEHHMYPRVPFYRLPALHRLFAGKSYRSTAWPLGAQVQEAAR